MSKTDIKLTLSSKVNVVTGSLMTCHICHGDNPGYVPNMVNQYQIKNSYGPDIKTSRKPYKFDLEFKVRGRILIMNVRDTSSCGNTPM